MRIVEGTSSSGSATTNHNGRRPSASRFGESSAPSNAENLSSGSSSTANASTSAITNDNKRPRLSSPSGYNSGDEHEHTRPKTKKEMRALVQKQLNFAKRLKERGLELKQMATDGNCLFRAVALQVYGDVEMHDTVRQLCMKHMKAERDHYSQFIAEDFDDYLTRKSLNGIHGNNTELQAIGELYNRPIEIYKDDSEEPLNLFHDEYRVDNPPLRLSYHGNCHYNALIDPTMPSVGVGLGLPGLEPGAADRNLLQSATRVSDTTATEDQLLHSVLEQTNSENLQDEVYSAVMEESRREYMAKLLQDALNSVGSVNSSNNNASSLLGSLLPITPNNADNNNNIDNTNNSNNSNNSNNTNNGSNNNNR